MSGAELSALDRLLAFPDVGCSDELVDAALASVTAEEIDGAVNAVLDADWSDKENAVFNVLCNPRLILSPDKRSATLLRALGCGCDLPALTLAAAVSVQSLELKTFGELQAEMFQLLLRNAVTMTGVTAHRCFAAASPVLTHPEHTKVVSWLASNHADKVVKSDALNWLVYAMYGSSPLHFQEVLSNPDASAFGGSAAAPIEADSLASVTLKFNGYCARRAAAPVGVTFRAQPSYLPSFSEMAMQKLFPDLPFDMLCQVAMAFRQMDSDGDGRVCAEDVDRFFKENEVEDSPAGASEVQRIGGRGATVFGMQQWIQSCLRGAMPQNDMM